MCPGILLFKTTDSEGGAYGCTPNSFYLFCSQEKIDANNPREKVATFIEKRGHGLVQRES